MGSLNFLSKNENNTWRQTLDSTPDAKQFVHIGISCKHIMVLSSKNSIEDAFFKKQNKQQQQLTLQ